MRQVSVAVIYYISFDKWQLGLFLLRLWGVLSEDGIGEIDWDKHALDHLGW